MRQLFIEVYASEWERKSFMEVITIEWERKNKFIEVFVRE